MRPSRSVSLTDPPTPAALGYRMPAEWEPHAATWIAWPHYEPDWPGKFEPIPWVYAEIVRHLSAVERVHIVVQHAGVERSALSVLRRSKVSAANVRFHRWRTNRGWTRDSGPIFLIRGAGRKKKVAMTQWRFHAWAKYSNWREDAKLPGHIHDVCRIPVWQPTLNVKGRKRRVVLEGGSIDVNGRGAMLTTEECLLSRVQQRNPGVSRKQLEQVFAEYLAVRSVIWLGGGIAGDDTHGHVDDIARFVAPDTVLACVERDRGDANHAPLAENLARLRAARDQDGRKLRMVALPMPDPVYFEGRRLPASYANFYIANRLVLVPVFSQPKDRIALNLLAELFPGRRIVGIYSTDFIWGFGAMHCMTQQQPK